MKAFIFLDSAPLGLLFQKAGIAPADACRAWAKDRLAAGAHLLVPEIVHYEIRRELLRLGKNKSLDAMERFVRADPDRFRVLTSNDLTLAAELWADARRRGVPTADAAQVLNSGIPLGDLVVATSNTKHLS